MPEQISGDKLRKFIERLEALEEQRRDLKADMNEIFAQAEAQGFEVPIMRELMRERRIDEEAAEQKRATMAIYRGALGMTGTPLGDAAARAESGRRNGQEEGPRPSA